MELNLSENEWGKLFRAYFDDDQDKADEYYGAGRWVKTVFDVYSLDVLSRMNKLGSFTFKELVEKYGGYAEYYERETVLLAKRVYRYLDEKNLIETESFSPLIDAKDWLQILLEKNPGTESQDTWKIKAWFQDALKKVDFSDKFIGWEKSHEAWKCAQEVIGLLIDGQTELYCVNDLFSQVKNAEKSPNFNGNKCTDDYGTFTNSIYFHTATLDSTQTGNDKFGPNYFYEKDEKYGLVSWLGNESTSYEETEHDVCQKKLSRTTTENFKKWFKTEFSATNEDVRNPKSDCPPYFDKHAIDKGPNDRGVTNSQKTNDIKTANYSCYVPQKGTTITFGFGYLSLYKYINVIGEEPINKTFLLFIEEDEYKKCKEKEIFVDGIKLVPDERKIKKEHYFFFEIPVAIVDRYKNEVDGKTVYTEVIKKVFDAICGVNAMNETEEKIKRILKNNKQIILTGAPGTGKTYLAKEIAKNLIGSEDDEVLKIRMGFCQFHPSYDYTDFVEGLRPKKQGDQIVFEREDGIFKKFCQKALNDQENKYVFIIDEINRGDISKIFGELFYAIDPGYRGKEGKILTQYSNLIESKENTKTEKDGKEVEEYGKYFYVPKNVYIIGTMNDIDRSVESMDFAIRRRFTWIKIEPADTQKAILGNDKKAIDKMNAINNVIKKNNSDLGEAYQLGASYFVFPKEAVAPDKDVFDCIWDYRIKPLLEEYLRGIPGGPGLLDALKKAYDNPKGKNSADDTKTSDNPKNDSANDEA